MLWAKLVSRFLSKLYIERESMNESNVFLHGDSPLINEITEKIKVLFAIKVAGIQTCNFVKETLILVFSFEFSENSCARVSF